ncbi:phytanoyl-CoA dioxygenase family protein [Embleya scabrispora]|uniref:phytanoyl-CoA dioxygenase family protein n=1 Tax=Embleya scabrispora TaxID=159449 RepID=UPI0003A934BA|nr:phytanoyl-CoA dioxygenase family protein [Embleya scabrispora]
MPKMPTRAVDGSRIDGFTECGYLLLPGFLPDDLVSRLEAEVDHWVDSGSRERAIAACVDPSRPGPPPVVEIELAAHGELAAHPPLLALVGALMGTDFVFHHLHSDRRPAGADGKAWHHDYEQAPQRDRTYTMIHALHYLGGLDASVGGLAVLPGSHREVADKDARAHLGCRELPGEVLIDELPPGSTVLVHSALFHARRPGPAFGGRPRYMVDGSYGQCGTRWPPVKPYWRHVLGRARELDLDRGHWPELFAERHFTRYSG